MLLVYLTVSKTWWVVHKISWLNYWHNINNNHQNFSRKLFHSQTVQLPVFYHIMRWLRQWWWWQFGEKDSKTFTTQITPTVNGLLIVIRVRSLWLPERSRVKKSSDVIHQNDPAESAQILEQTVGIRAFFRSVYKLKCESRCISGSMSCTSRPWQCKYLPSGPLRYWTILHR